MTEPDWRATTFGVEVYASGDFAFVVVRGEVDNISADALRNQLHEIVDHGALDLVIDLSQVSYIGTAGLGAIAGASSQLRPWKGHLVVRNASRTARRLLEILGLEREFQMQSLNEATAQPVPLGVLG